MIKIYGKNLLKETILNKAPLKEIYVLNTERKMIDLLNEHNLKYKITDKQTLNNLFGNNHQGIGAIRADYKTYSLDYFFSEESEKRILILDGLNDPQNFGAIIRTADAFNFKGIILGNNRSVPITSVVAHVSTGAIEYVPICYVNSLANAVKQLKEYGYWIISAEAFGNTNITDISLDRNIALIIGSEGFGISKTLLKESDYIVSIGMKGHVNSLNASVSAGILMEKLK